MWDFLGLLGSPLQAPEVYQGFLAPQESEACLGKPGWGLRDLRDLLDLLVGLQ